MSRVLVLSSWVACGHVGLSAAAPVLQAMGLEVVGLPTVMLSNHPGFDAVAGTRVAVDDLAAMTAALASNGWLAGVDAVLTGYLPTPAHVGFATSLIARARAARPDVVVVVDPVLGDDPKGLYIDRAAAEALRDGLLPLADVTTPNAFELGWLSGQGPLQEAELVPAARALGPARVLVTSVGRQARESGVLDVRGAHVAHFPVALRAGVPHGVGDVFAALIAGGLATGAALGHVQALIAGSLGAPHLAIAGTRAAWTAAEPIKEGAWPLISS